MCCRWSATFRSINVLSNWTGTSNTSLRSISQHTSTCRFLLIQIRIRRFHMTFAGWLVGISNESVWMHVVGTGKIWDSTLHNQICFTLNATLCDWIQVGKAVSHSSCWKLNSRCIMRVRSWICRTTTVFSC